MNGSDKQYYGTKGLSLAIVIGVAIGTVIGKLMNNMNVGLMVGIVLGVCGWVLITRLKSAKKSGQPEDETPGDGE